MDIITKYNNAAETLSNVLNAAIEGDVSKAVLRSAIDAYHHANVALLEKDATDDINDEEVADIEDGDDVKDSRPRRRLRGARKSETPERETITMDAVSVAKAIQNGSPNSYSKAQWFGEIDKRAQAKRAPTESVAQAFSKYVEHDAEGKVLYAAYKNAGGEDHRFIVNKDDGPTSGADLPALAEIKRLASQHQADNPGKSYEQSFASVYTDPANRDLVAQHKTQARDAAAEQSGIDAARRWGVQGQFRPAGSTGRTEQRAS